MDEQNQHQQPEDVQPHAERQPSEEPTPQELTRRVEGEYQPPPVASPPPSRPDTHAFIVWGFILAGLGLLCCCCPPPFAIASIVLGAIAYSRGDQRGLWVIIAGAVVLLLGSGLSIFVWPLGYLEDWHRSPIPRYRI